MERFYGSAVFEGEEVADSAYNQLLDIRSEEERRIQYHHYEFRAQIDELDYWLRDTLSTIYSQARAAINHQNRQISLCYQNINRIMQTLQSSIMRITAKYLRLLKTKNSHAAYAAIAIATSEARNQIGEQYRLINSARNEIYRIRSNATRATATAHMDYASGYNIRLTRRDKDIAWTHADATDKIAAVFARRFYTPVFKYRHERGVCEYCRAKSGTTGTEAELETQHCIPPIHEHCRCWLEEVGYVVMTR